MNLSVISPQFEIKVENQIGDNEQRTVKHNIVLVPSDSDNSPDGRKKSERVSS